MRTKIISAAIFLAIFFGVVNVGQIVASTSYSGRQTASVYDNFVTWLGQKLFSGPKVVLTKTPKTTTPYPQVFYTPFAEPVSEPVTNIAYNAVAPSAEPAYMVPIATSIVTPNDKEYVDAAIAAVYARLAQVESFNSRQNNSTFDSLATSLNSAVRSIAANTAIESPSITGGTISGSNIRSATITGSSFSGSTGTFTGDVGAVNLDLTGLIHFADISPSVTTNRLYSTGGDLYWAGNVLSSATTGNWTSDGTHVWRATGNVGVGTSSPYAKLSVVGPVVAEYFHATSSTASSTFAGGIDAARVCITGTNTCLGAGGGTVNSGTQGQIAFYNANGTAVTGTSTIGVASTGFVGINNSNPATNFVVTGEGAPYKTQMQIIDTGDVAAGTGGWGAGISIFGSDAGANNTGRIIFFGKEGAGSNDILFRNEIASDFRIQTNGQQRLIINNNTANRGQLTIVDQNFTSDHDNMNAAITGYGSDIGAGSTGRSWFIGNDGGAKQFDIFYQQNAPMAFFTNATQRLTILGGGNVGIGSSSPNSSLVVNGDTGITLTESGGRTFNINGPVGGAKTMFSNLGVSIGYGFAVGGTEQFSISSAGSIGVGTTTPRSRISVTGIGTTGLLSLANSSNVDQFTVDSVGNVATGGNIRFGANSGGSGIFGYSSSGAQILSLTRQNNTQNGTAAINAYGGFGIVTNNTSGAPTENYSMFVNTVGNVGISSSSPSGLLSFGNVTLPTLRGLGMGILFDGKTVSPHIAWDDGTSGFASIIGENGSFRVFTSSGGGALTSGNERFRVDSSGSVGIGTTTPLAGTLLNVNANSGSNNPTIDISNSGTNTGFPILEFDDNRASGHSWGIENGRYAGKFSISDYSPFNTRFVIDTSGNVGIGTTTPGSFLPNGAGASTRILDIMSGSGSLDAGVQIRDSLNLVGLDLWQDAAGPSYIDTRWNSDSSSLNFRTKTSGTPVNAMTILGSGSVGIGTTTPSLRLQIAGVSSLPATTGTTQTGVLRLSSNGSTASLTSVLDMGSYNSTGAGWIQATDLANLASIYALLLNPNGGNVGIGTTSPGAKLDVFSAGGALRISDSRDQSWAIGDTMNSLEFYSADNSGTSAKSVRGAINMVIESDTFGAKQGMAFFTKGDVAGYPLERMRITQTGNVGIGTTTPIDKLDVYGNVRISGLGVGTSGYFADNGGLVDVFSLTRQNAVTAADLSISAYGGIGLTSSRTTNNPAASGYGLYVNTSNNVGIGTTSPGSRLAIAGTYNGTVPILSVSTSTIGATSTVFQINSNGTFLANHPNATSTINGNLFINGTSRASIAYVGDLVFSNDFRFIESTSSPQALYLRNQVGNTILGIDESGNLNVSGDLCYGNQLCLGKSLSQLKEQYDSLSSSTLSLGKTNVKDTIITDLGSTTIALADEIRLLKAETSSTTDRLINLISFTATTTENNIASSASFIERIASAVKTLLQSAGEWAMDKLYARIVNTDELRAKNINSGNIDTETICIGKTCVNEAQLQGLLRSANMPITQTPEPRPTETVVPDVTEVPEVPEVTSTTTTAIATSTTSSTNPSEDKGETMASSTEPVIEDTPSPSPTVIPSTTPTSEVNEMLMPTELPTRTPLLETNTTESQSPHI